MAKEIVYMKLERNIEVQSPEVFLTDVASVRCKDNVVSAKIKAIKIHRFNASEQKRCVISVLKIIEMMEKECPGIMVESLGETDVLLEWISVNKHKGWQQWLKAALVALVSFFGTAFTIMAYHNDIEIARVFGQIHTIVMGQEPQGVSVLEVAYSVGLGLGIIVFFNHIGGRNLTKDPTPIEVALRKYEQDVDMTLIDTADREGKIIDVD
ncbi:MAG: stage V sporulation protein AA [Lachnospiraceae bacterium]|nr:stage V sporulation protein AA [Lachnospiraceae bacterium]